MPVFAHSREDADCWKRPCETLGCTAAHFCVHHVSERKYRWLVLAACLMERKLERFDKNCTGRVEVKEWKKRLRRSAESEQ